MNETQTNKEAVKELEAQKGIVELEVYLNFCDLDDVKTKCFIVDAYIPRHPDVDDVPECEVSIYAKRLDTNEAVTLTEGQIEVVEEKFWEEMER